MKLVIFTILFAGVSFALASGKFWKKRLIRFPKKKIILNDSFALGSSSQYEAFKELAGNLENASKGLEVLSDAISETGDLSKLNGSIDPDTNDVERAAAAIDKTSAAVGSSGDITSGIQEWSSAVASLSDDLSSLTDCPDSCGASGDISGHAKSLEDLAKSLNGLTEAVKGSTDESASMAAANAVKAGLIDGLNAASKSRAELAGVARSISDPTGIFKAVADASSDASQALSGLSAALSEKAE